MNFPTNHPLCGGFAADPYLQSADLILVIDYARTAPFLPDKDKLRTDVKVIYMDNDPLKPYNPLWIFPADAIIQADSGKAIPLLTQMVRQKVTPERKVAFQTRFGKLKSDHEKMREEWRRSAIRKASQKPISIEWASHCIANVVSEDMIIMAEPDPIGIHHIVRTKPRTWFARFGPCLGWTLGAAIGAKLAAPDKTVVALTGDGAMNFDNPVAALWAANVYHAPFLTVVFNNRGMLVGKNSIQDKYGKDCYTAKAGWKGTTIDPTPNYALISQGCGNYGQVVEEPSELEPALRKALDLVRSGKPALLDVRIEDESVAMITHRRPGW